MGNTTPTFIIKAKPTRRVTTMKGLITATTTLVIAGLLTINSIEGITLAQNQGYNPAENQQQSALDTVTVIKAVTQILTPSGIIAGGFWAIWQYADKKKTENDTKIRELKKPFLKYQLTLYLEASRVASELATSKNEFDEKTLNRFWQLYYGELALVESPEVEQAMINFGNALKKFQKTGHGQEELCNNSLELAYSCRKSIEKRWNIELGNLQKMNLNDLV